MDSIIETANKQQPKEALNTLLEGALEADTIEFEDSWCPAVVNALSGLKDTDAEINPLIAPLQIVQQDALMRAIYYGLERTDNGLSLLKWHGALVKKAGVGCVVRYLCERSSNKTSDGDADDDD
ncbi:hypothetical protein BLNAU_10460 [Blattamonas nauphoetae]|uniref:Actin-related protein 2/3 complex subunit 5 n=1 Tax=Blattamonas nauphoetae TaxID=2049346 RepID=A0ABQ9XST5_9EUKA|nr:hypothetical protein BLNAU_10460 [Blattamonas nauphoetae]